MHTKTLLAIALCAGIPAHLAAQGGIGGRLNDVPRAQAANPKPAPRLADGHPDLGNGKGAWNPRTIVNLSGTGTGGANRSPVEKVIEVPFKPEAKTEYDRRLATLSKDDPESLCLPPGIPRMMATPFPFQIFQQPDRVIFIFEGAAHVWRVIYTDGRPHTKDPNPTYLGESIGHWEGDTLATDVIGFNDRTWLDQDGHPHGEALHIMEKFTRLNELSMRYEVTIDDPEMYTKPWTTSYLIPFVPGGELFEYICQENNIDVRHLVGK
ncbi:MAG TPA: hypothetical protein VGJ09_02475 [Bryobacteraceae bacterium]